MSSIAALARWEDDPKRVAVLRDGPCPRVRTWATRRCKLQRQKQVPCGDDYTKGKDNEQQQQIPFGDDKQEKQAQMQGQSDGKSKGKSRSSAFGEG